MFQRLLICTDLNDGLQQLGRSIDSFAALGVQQITFLYSKPVEETKGVPRLEDSEIAQVKADVQRWLPDSPTVTIAIEVQMGRITEAILQTAAKYQADLILLGTASKTNLNEKLFGSTTIELAKKTSIPLLILRPQLLDVMTREELNLRCRQLFQRLLIPYNGSPAAQHIVDRVVALNQPQGAVSECTLCWVNADRNWLSLPEAEQAALADQQLAPAEAKLQSVAIQTARAIHQGNALQGILATARVADITAIAIASNSLGTILEWTTPSLTGDLIRQSWYPLLFLPQPN
jgi:nucleotide-binding universal stress UspA family protein